MDDADFIDANLPILEKLIAQHQDRGQLGSHPGEWYQAAVKGNNKEMSRNTGCLEAAIEVNASAAAHHNATMSGLF